MQTTTTPDEVVLGLAPRCSAEVRGTPVKYIDEGEGLPVVLLHGAPLTSLAFARLVRGLRRHHRVIAPDLPGFGGTALPVGFDGSLASHAQFVCDFCEHLGLERFVVFVHDSSGCIGLAAASRMAERIAGVVICGTVPIPMTGLSRPVRWLLRWVVSSAPMRWINGLLNLLPWLVVTIAPWRRPFTRAQRRVLVKLFNSRARRDRVLGLFWRMATESSFLARVADDVRRHLRHTPALLVFGQLDPMRFVGGVRRFAAMFPAHDVAIVPWEEHFPMLAAGEELAAVMGAWIQRSTVVPSRARMVERHAG